MISLYAIHGILQMIVFFGLYPMGALVAILRGFIGPSWRSIHVTMQLLGTMLLLVAVGLIAYAMKRDKVEEKELSRRMRVHIWLGRMVLALVLTQILWAYFGRGLVDWTTWYYTHMTLSALVLIGGWTNIFIAKTHDHDHGHDQKVPKTI